MLYKVYKVGFHGGCSKAHWLESLAFSLPQTCLVPSGYNVHHILPIRAGNEECKGKKSSISAATGGVCSLEIHADLWSEPREERHGSIVSISVVLCG